jgi:hypothetical protein
MPIACDATPVQYKPYVGSLHNLGNVPWIAASPASAGLLGHLFYWGSTPWGQTHRRVPRLRIYTRGHAPGSQGINMKILWELTRGSAWGVAHGSDWGLSVQGRRLDGPGSFKQRFAGDNQFPSIVVVPKPGCWSLTVKAGKATAHLTLLAFAAAKG